MRSRKTYGGVWLAAMTFMGISTAFADTPIGMLDVQGRVHTEPGPSLLQDRHYACFSRDSIQTEDNARADAQFNNGLRPTLAVTADNDHGAAALIESLTSAWLVDDEAPSS